MNNVIVIGGGAAGMMAAGTAALRGKKVILLEKNEKLGKKLYITGKGRCNVTNAIAPDKMQEHIVGNKQFLYSSLYGFDAFALMDFFEQHNVKLKMERGNRVFPESDKASDIIKGLVQFLHETKVDVRLHTQANEICMNEYGVTGVVVSNGAFLPAESVIVATGGLSYPATGSTGDGYLFAKQAGHFVTPCYPSLVSLQIKEMWPKQLSGLSLKNIDMSFFVNGKKAFCERGEMLFTHFGISGPLVLRASRHYAGNETKVCTVDIDTKPALCEADLDLRLLRDFETAKNKQFKNALNDLLPMMLVPIVVSLSGIDPQKQVNAITQTERKQLVKLLKGLTMHIVGTMGYSEAVVTTGGVCVKEVNPKTMESKLLKGLFFAGEVLDVDGYTGGFNLQIAFSTGRLAGEHA